jgi:spore coat protein A, manganese oxidase
VLPESNGYPEAWFSPHFGQVGPYWTQQTYFYPNDQQATTLWYHDHAVAITRLNVHTGLVGMYIERRQRVPSAARKSAFVSLRISRTARRSASDMPARRGRASSRDRTSSIRR